MKRNDKELKYYGVHACLALFKRRKEAIVRVYLDSSLIKIFSPLLKWCAQEKIAYHIVPGEELCRISDSVHHEGVCILAREKPFISWQEICSLPREGPACWLYLDGVQNPHNIGSILRSAAHFGIKVILGEAGKLPALSPSACRIAKGAAEMVDLAAIPKPEKALLEMKRKGFCLIAASAHEGQPLYQFRFPGRSIIALGAESEGLSKAILALADHRVRIPGTGLVESLNVSIAASLLLSEFNRR